LVRRTGRPSTAASIARGLRCGDLQVPGSRRYTDPVTLLLPTERWASLRDDFYTITDTDPDRHRQPRATRRRAADR